MKVEPLPWIERADFDAIRKLIAGDFPETYEAWEEAYNKEEAHRRTLSEVRSIRVRPDDFARYCRNERGGACVGQDLLRFAIVENAAAEARANPPADD